MEVYNETKLSELMQDGSTPSKRHPVVTSSSHDGRLLTTIRLSSTAADTATTDTSSDVAASLALLMSARQKDGGQLASLKDNSADVSALALLMSARQKEGQLSILPQRDFGGLKDNPADVSASLALLMSVRQKEGPGGLGRHKDHSDSEDSDMSSMDDDGHGGQTMPQPWMTERHADNTSCKFIPMSDDYCEFFICSYIIILFFPIVSRNRKCTTDDTLNVWE